MTRKELEKFDGSNGAVYIAYRGKVYDVSKSDLFEDGVHFEHYAGQDLTEFLGEAPHDQKVLSRFPIIGELED